MTDLSAVHAQACATSAALLAAHKTRARQELIADLTRLFWRDHPEATPSQFNEWHASTQAEIGRLPS